MIETTTHIKTEKQLVPALRFKEFEGVWDKNKLGAISKITTGSTPSTSVDEFYNGNYLFVSPADMQGNRYIKNTKTTLTEAGFDKCRKLKKGSVLFVCIGSTIGKVAQSISECSSNQQINALEAKENFSNDFIYSLLEKNGQRIKLLAGVQAVPQINKTDFSNFKYLFPSLPEQQKIASFLSAVDEKIQQLTKKKKLLEHYKKGVMQQLFSGQLRFKDENGNPYPDWEEKTLLDIATFRRGSFPQPYGLPEWYDDNGAPFVQVYDVANNMLLKPKTKQYISEAAQKQSVLVKKGTLVLTIQGSIGRLAKTQYDAYVDRTLLIFQSYKVDMDIDYFKYVVYLLFEIEKTRAPGGTIKTITKEKLSSFNVYIPCLEEQQKIATYLSSIDTKIESVKIQITQTQTFKKGLLQQMFVAA